MTQLSRWTIGNSVLSAALALASCSTPPAQAPAAAAVDTRAADEAAIRATDAAWVRAAGAKDVAATVSFYDANAVLMVPGAPITTGKEAIEKMFTGLMADKNFALSFTPDKVGVSKGGDLAYEIGDYAMTTSDKKGKPQTAKAKYVVVWGKQADGTWKALADVPNTTTP
jgi:uncharacterized protein (TIGR02246 family)